MCSEKKGKQYLILLHQEEIINNKIYIPRDTDVNKLQILEEL